MPRGSIRGQGRSVSSANPTQALGFPREIHALREIQARIAALEVTQREVLKFVRSKAGDVAVSLKGAAELLGQSGVKTVQRMLDKGSLGWVPVGSGDKRPTRAVPLSEIQRYIRENFVPAAADIAKLKIEEDFDAK